MRGLILAATLLILAAAAFAQPELLWQQTYGGTSYDHADGVVQTADGGFVFGGRNCSAAAGNCDFWLVKVNPQGEQLWSHTFGTPGDEWSEVIEATEGGFIQAGSTTSGNNQDFYLVRTNGEGQVVWSHSYARAGWERAYAVQPYRGGFIAVGSASGEDGDDIYAVRTNAQGEQLWARTYGGPSDEGAFGVAVVENGFVIAGHTASYGAGNWDIYIIRTDTSGNPLWTRTYGGAGRDFPESIKALPDGGFIVGGVCGTNSQGYSDGYLLRLNNDGNLIWSRSFGTPEADATMDVVPTPDGGFFAVGVTHNQPYDGWLVKTNGAGEVQWSRNVGGTSEDWMLDALVARDGGLMGMGFTRSSGHGDADAFLVSSSPNKARLRARIFSRCHRPVCPTPSLSTAPLSTACVRSRAMKSPSSMRPSASARPSSASSGR